MTYETILTESDHVALANGMEEGDVAAFAITAELVAKEFALLNAVIRAGWSIRQDGKEWVFSNPNGEEAGRIFDIRARP
jgi:hypothetical protein